MTLIKKFLIGLISIIIISLLGFKTYQYFRNHTYDHLTKDLEVIENNEEPEEYQTQGTINVLLLGLDNPEYGQTDIQNQESRSDAIVLLSLNPDKKTTKILNIPRDTRVYNSRNTLYDKINHAYVTGGPKLTVNLVEKLLDIPIHHYASVNMSGISTLIDQLGGLELTPTLTFGYGGSYFESGISQKMSGGEVMNYMRMRYEDPKGDFGRQERQRQVLKALFKRIKDLNPVEITQTLPFIAGHVRTDVTIPEAISYIGYQKSLENVESIETQGAFYDANIMGVYYAIIGESARHNISQELRKNSGLPETTFEIYYEYDYLLQQSGFNIYATIQQEPEQTKY